MLRLRPSVLFRRSKSKHLYSTPRTQKPFVDIMINSIMKTITVLAFLMITALVAGQGIAQDADTEIHMPSFSELEESWNTMKPGGETSCAHGTEFEFYIRAGDPSKLLVYLYGGGACFDAESCNEGSGYYFERIEPWMYPDGFRGILDRGHKENPFRDHTMISIPVCTGDVHLGNRDQDYVLHENDGTTRAYTIRHRGQINVDSALKWIQQNMPEVHEIFVSGLSAGGIAVPFYANRLARAYPDARVVGLGDAAGAFSSRVDSLQLDPENNPARWGLPYVVREHPGWEEFPGQSGIQDLHILGSRGVSNLRLYQVDHANDANQAWRFRQLGHQDPDLPEILRSHRSEIQSEVPASRAFILGGYRHGILTENEFYRISVGNVALRDWTAAIAAGVEVPDVVCEECSRPDFIFDEDDLSIINALISRLSEPGSWNPNDEEGACPENAESWTLRCAISDVVHEKMDHSPGDYPVAHDIINEAVVRTGYDRERGSSFPALRLYNNAPGRTHAEILEFLETVRERIRLQLDSESDNGEE
jgi:hypothetical protein